MSRLRGPSAPALVLAGAMAALTAWVLFLTRGGTFHYDEWVVAMERRGRDLDTLFAPHNEHIYAVPFLVFKVMLEVVGQAPYWPFQLLSILAHLLVTGVVYVSVRRVTGPWTALVPALAVLALGAAWENIMWPFQIGLMVPLALFLIAVRLLERDRRRADAGAAALLSLGVLTSSLGVPLAGAAALTLLTTRRVRRAALVLAPPLVAYLAWDARWGVAETPLSGLPGVPRLVLDLSVLNVGALTSTPASIAAVLVVGLLVLTAREFVRGRPFPTLLVAVGLGALLVWTAQALFRPGSTPSRYLYPGGVLVAIYATLLLAPWLARIRLDRRTGIVAGVVAAVVLAGQVEGFLTGGRHFRTWAEFTRSSLIALEVVGPGVQPMFWPDPVRAFHVRARPYFDARRDYGSPVGGPEDLAELGEEARQNADVVVAAGVGLTVTPAAKPPRTSVPEVSASAAVALSPRRDGCLDARATAPGGQVETVVPPGGLWLRRDAAPAKLRLRRFADGYPAGDDAPGRQYFTGYESVPTRDFLRPTVFDVPGEPGGLLDPPADGAPGVPWRAQVTTDGAVTLCAVGPG